MVPIHFLFFNPGPNNFSVTRLSSIESQPKKVVVVFVVVVVVLLVVVLVVVVGLVVVVIIVGNRNLISKFGQNRVNDV